MTLFRNAVKIANSYLIYIPFLALSGIFIWTESTRYYALLSAVLSFILYPVVYGSIVEKIQKVTQSSWTALFARHIFNYLGLTLIFVVPVLALNPLISGLDSSIKSVVNALIGMFIQCVALYIWPLLFIKRRIFSSIYDGLAFLLHDPSKSAIMFLLIILTSVVKLVAKLSAVSVIQKANITLIFGIGYLQNIIIGYVGLIIFSMAATLLLEEATNTARTESLQET
jgi:hypothetical protein